MAIDLKVIDRQSDFIESFIQRDYLSIYLRAIPNPIPNVYI